MSKSGKNIFRTLGWVLLAFCLLFSAAWGEELTGWEIFCKAYSQAGSARGFSADIYLYLIPDRPLLPQVLGDLSTTSVLKGRLSYNIPKRFSLTFYLPNGTETRGSCSDGVSLSFVPSEGFPALENNPEAVSNNIPQAISLKNSPLNLLVPLPLKMEFEMYQVELLPDETANGFLCYPLLIKGSPLGYCKIWVDKQDFLIQQIDSQDQDGTLTEAKYKGFQTFGEDNFTMPTNIAVSQNGMSLFTAEIILSYTPVTSAPTTYSEISALPGTSVPNLTSSRPLVAPPAPPKGMNFGLPLSSSEGLMLLFSFLVLIYLGTRYIDKMALQATFSRELIVVDKEQGELLRLLREAGYQGVPFTPELLTEERKFLNNPPKGVLPRAVIIGENSIRRIKQYLYLLRAYLEEGGRVLIFPHGKEFSAELPYQPEYFPYDPETIGKPAILVRNPDMWSDFSRNQIGIRTSPIMPSEIVLRVNNQWVDRELVTLQNQVLGLSAMVLGVQKMKKGEILICQYHILSALLKEGGKSDYSKVLIDLISYLQRRPEDRSF